jgi:L-2-hydroxyglutarate oxidase LhgO
MTTDFDVIVVGAGVVGLAVARELAMGGAQVAVLEAEPGIARHASSRNSGVVHAGIYYAPGSLKAELCLEGRASLLQYAAARSIRVLTPGKLIVATSTDEVAALERIEANARACGMTSLRWCDGDQATELEPLVRCHAALFSPGTAVIDTGAFLDALAGDVRDHGGAVVLGCGFTGARPEGHALAVTAGGDTVRCRHLVLAAGTRTPTLAAAIAGMPTDALGRSHLAKGSYFAIAGGPRFTRLVYPVPVPGGLGTHVTLDVEGNARLGPDVEWIDRIDYTVDPRKAAAFAGSVARWAPHIREHDLRPDYAGIRAKRVGPGEPAADFAILGPAAHGVASVTALVGIESPGLTASLALARRVSGGVRPLL